MKGFYVIFLLIIYSTCIGQDYDIWKDVIEQQFKDIPIAARQKKVNITFGKERKSGNPYATIFFTYYLVNLQQPKHLEVFKLYHDDNSTISKIKVNRKKIKPSIGPYESNALFHTDIVEQSFNIPFRKPRHERRVQYRLKITDLKYLGQLYFQEDFAIKEFELLIKIPEWLNLEVNEFNFDDLPIQQSREIDDKGFTNYSYSYSNLRPYQKVPHMQGPTYSYPHLLFVTNSYLNKEGKWQSVFRNLDDLYTYYNELIQKIKPTKKATIETYLHKVLPPNIESKELAEQLFNYVKSNIKYVAFEDGMAGYIPENGETVFNNGYGDCKGMSNLLFDMLKSRGFDARHTWLGTNYIAYDYLYASLAVDNHMIVTLFLDGDTIYLDPTDKLNKFGQVAPLIAGRPVMIANGSSYNLARIPELKAEANKISFELIYPPSILKSAPVNQQLNIILYGQPRAEINEYINRPVHLDDFNKWNDYFKASNYDVSISSITNHTFEDVIKANLETNVSKNIEQFGAETYIRCFPITSETTKKIESDRLINFLFPYPKEESFKTVFHLPAGYQVTQMPTNATYENKLIRVAYTYAIVQNQIVMTKMVRLKENVISVTDFGEWNSIINEINLQEEERIIIKK